MSKIKLIGVGVSLVIATIVALASFEFKTVKGGQLGIKETWNDGVVNTVLQPRNYYLFPGFTQEIYTYDATLLVYELPDFVIKSSDNQEMTIRSKVQWRRDPSKLVRHHTMFKQNAEAAAINPAMIGAILRHGTTFKALDAYSGDGLIKMQTDIAKDLAANTQLKDDGIIIESYIIVYNHLKPEYLETINTRQLATLRQSAAVEKQKAAEAEALVAKAEAQANLNRMVVEAERDKQVKVLAAQAENERTVIQAKAENERAILAAQAEQQKLILEAEGQKQAMLATAQGKLALGKAEAESKELLLKAYSVQGADAWVKTEISKNMADAYKNIKGYLPEKMNVTVLSDSFEKAVDLVTGNTLVPTTPAKAKQ
jgi:regulator of protease activity HflC (stomatin/prohibitin superfamily)